MPYLSAFAGRDLAECLFRAASWLRQPEQSSASILAIMPALNQDGYRLDLIYADTMGSESDELHPHDWRHRD